MIPNIPLINAFFFSVLTTLFSLSLKDLLFFTSCIKYFNSQARNVNIIKGPINFNLDSFVAIKFYDIIIYDCQFFLHRNSVLYKKIMRKQISQQTTRFFLFVVFTNVFTNLCMNWKYCCIIIYYTKFCRSRIECSTGFIINWR